MSLLLFTKKKKKKKDRIAGLHQMDLTQNYNPDTNQRNAEKIKSIPRN